jgi:hypothetical protein
MRPLAKQLEEQQHVVYIDKDSAPRILFYGEDFWLEDLPVGTRVIYPRAPLAPVPNLTAAIRYAINHPEGMDPLHALLKPGMRVTVAMDDISLPLPPMRTPDVRQRILEVVLELLADNGVDDVHLIVATSLHRRMKGWEVKRMVGDKIYNAYWPDRLYNHDAEDPEGMVTLGQTEEGYVSTLNRRAAESDLLVYVNINLVPMDGGHKSVGVGLCGYETLKAHHTPHAIRKSNSYMDPDHSELASIANKIGRLVDDKVKTFHIETVLNNRMYDGQMEFLCKNEDEFSDFDRIKFNGLKWTLGRVPRPARREIFMRVPAAYDVAAVYAGATEPCHARTLAKCFEQYAVPVRGQADIVISGVPFISPYNVNSVLNPLLVQVMGLGYFFNMYRGKPLLKKGGTLILCHPAYDDFDAEQHPSYIEFFNRLLPETRDAMVLKHKYEEEFAKNPTYIEMYRRGNAYHGAHPFYMWYWGENGRQHVGNVIVAGAENAYVPKMLGWKSADTLSDAIDMARADHGRSAEITLMHHPPILITDVE